MRDRTTQIRGKGAMVKGGGLRCCRSGRNDDDDDDDSAMVCMGGKYSGMIGRRCAKMCTYTKIV